VIPVYHVLSPRTCAALVGATLEDDNWRESRGISRAHYVPGRVGVIAACGTRLWAGHTLIAKKQKCGRCVKARAARNRSA
jgi:hypothetical protein